MTGPAEDARPAAIAIAAAPLPEAPPLVPPAAMFPDALSLLDSAGDVRPLGEIEGELIRYAVSRYRGRMSEVARRLQIGRSTLYRKLEALGLHGGGADPGSEGVAGERQPRKIA
jgi:DNA-binding NtrC family response regulator